MTTEFYNSLPLEARSFIQKNAGCITCGNTEMKLSNAYELYKSQKIMKAYQIIGGAVNYSKKGQKGVLTSLNDKDLPKVKRNKIEIARAIHEVQPHMFSIFNEDLINEIFDSLPEEKIINLDDEIKDIDVVDSEIINEKTEVKKPIAKKKIKKTKEIE